MQERVPLKAHKKMVLAMGMPAAETAKIRDSTSKTMRSFRPSDRSDKELNK
jgi:hypothetical protein